MISTLLLFLQRVRWVWVSVCYNLFWLQTSKTQRWKPAAGTKQLGWWSLKLDSSKMILWFVLLWSYDCLLHAYLTTDSAHPSLNGRVAKILTRELVYYILLGTLRGSQKYHWPVLRVPFGGDIHLFLICEEIPNQILWITKYLYSGFNSDLLKKKKSKSDKFGLLQIPIFIKWEPLLDSCNFGISGRIWTNFFFKWARILPRV